MYVSVRNVSMMHAHRPVKVIRLLGRNTVEEIILRRAEAKLQLTSAVIEGGHFSLGASKDALVADNNLQVRQCFFTLVVSMDALVAIKLIDLQPKHHHKDYRTREPHFFNINRPIKQCMCCHSL